MTSDYRRPVQMPTDVFDWIIGAEDPATAHLLARETSWALLDRVRDTATVDPEIVERVLRHAQHDGVDDIAELWATAHRHSLAGVLWRLYLLRRAVAASPEAAALLFRRGMEQLTTIDPIVAGAAEPVTPESLAQLCDTILRGVFTGSFADALDRARAYARVMANGSAALADDRDEFDDRQADQLTRRAYRYTQIAEDLAVAATRWREGSLE